MPDDPPPTREERVEVHVVHKNTHCFICYLNLHYIFICVAGQPGGHIRGGGRGGTGLGHRSLRQGAAPRDQDLWRGAHRCATFGGLWVLPLGFIV